MELDCIGLDKTIFAFCCNLWIVVATKKTECANGILRPFIIGHWANNCAWSTSTVKYVQNWIIFDGCVLCVWANQPRSELNIIVRAYQFCLAVRQVAWAMGNGHICAFKHLGTFLVSAEFCTPAFVGAEFLIFYFVLKHFSFFFFVQWSVTGQLQEFGIN